MTTAKLKGNGTPNEYDLEWPPFLRWAAGVLSVLIAAGVISTFALHQRVAVMNATNCQSHAAILEKIEAANENTQQWREWHDSHYPPSWLVDRLEKAEGAVDNHEH